jgi:hypothetical protein
VLGLAEAKEAVAEMLATTPPAGLVIAAGGAQTRPSSRADIDRQLQDLVAQGLLNP